MIYRYPTKCHDWYDGNGNTNSSCFLIRKLLALIDIASSAVFFLIYLNNLVKELKKLRHITVEVIPVVTGALGILSKKFRKSLRKIGT